MLTTFKAFCDLADFSDAIVVEEPTREFKGLEGEEKRRVKVEPRIQVNVEIHIAADTPDEKIEAIFRNMRQYLLPNE